MYEKFYWFKFYLIKICHLLLEIKFVNKMNLEILNREQKTIILISELSKYYQAKIWKRKKKKQYFFFNKMMVRY